MSIRDFVRFLGELLFRNDEILVYCRSLTHAGAVERADDPRVYKGTLADLAAMRAQRRPTPWELQCDVYDGVRDFFVYTDAGTVGHISWLYYKDDPNRILQLQDGECEVKFCLTFPEFRGRGLYPAALRAIQEHLQERGYVRCFICVKTDNAASIHGIEKAGFVRVGSTRLRKALGVQISMPWSTRQLAPASEDQRWIA
jgi:RimJ/RimL family protein N-acetyltransferase